MELIGIIALIGFIAYAIATRNAPPNNTERKPTSPWTIIGWIVLVCIILALGFCSMVFYGIGKAEIDRKNGIDPKIEDDITARLNANKPALFAKQIAIKCTQDEVGATIQNVGSHDIRFAKGFFHLKTKKGAVAVADDSYFSPSTIPPGSSASVNIYPDGAKFDECVLISVQDTDGTRVSLE